MAIATATATKCSWCGKPAVVTDKGPDRDGTDHYCHNCATFTFARARGEHWSVAAMLVKVIEEAAAAGITEAELHGAVTEIIGGEEEVMLGAEREGHEAFCAQCDALGGRGHVEAHPLPTDRFVPIAEAA